MNFENATNIEVHYYRDGGSISISFDYAEIKYALLLRSTLMDINNVNLLKKYPLVQLIKGNINKHEVISTYSPQSTQFRSIYNTLFPTEQSRISSTNPEYSVLMHSRLHDIINCGII